MAARPFRGVALRHVLPIPPHLRGDTRSGGDARYYATAMTLSEDVTVQSFCNAFRALVCRDALRMHNGTIIVHTEHLGLRHVSTKNIELVQEMYKDVYPALRDSVHSSIIVVQSMCVQAALKLVTRNQTTPATEVHVVATADEAVACAKTIAANVHAAALRPASAPPVRMASAPTIAVCIGALVLLLYGCMRGTLPRAPAL